MFLFSWAGHQDALEVYLFFMLLLEGGMIGVFVALDLVLFFVFWELTLVPMYFLIGELGRAAPRLCRAQVLHLHHGRQRADAGGHPGALRPTAAPSTCWSCRANSVAPNLQTWLFLAFALAFAIKVPIFPFHTWLPDAHVEAPTGGSVILAGVLLKMGTYGFLRFCLPLFPEATRTLRCR